MVDELRFEDNHSTWEQFRRSQQDYIQWAEDKKGLDRVLYPFVTGQGMTTLQGEHMPEGQKIAFKKQDKLVQGDVANKHQGDVASLTESGTVEVTR